MGLAAAGLGWRGSALAAVVPEPTPPLLAEPGTAFLPAMVDDIARKLAAAPYEGPSTELPESLQNLEYVQYRDIYFRPDSAVWKGGNLPFLVEFFHRGFYFKEKIDVAIVDGGTARHVVYEPRLFGFGKLVPRPLPTEDIGFAGMRLATRLGRDDDNFGEFLVFQGASYFRSLGIGETYGISARGLAVKTASPDGEEFPLFREFWIEQPRPESTEIVVHALLDSPSVAGAYHFRVRPGKETAMDVTAKLFPRVDLAEIGLAPGTSMFFFDGNGRVNVDDYRPEVHDSDGLLMMNGAGERLWRPLANPRDLQISAFQDNNPVGFGLIQRDRAFASYQDLEADYQNRPSLWVEPVGAWGPGAVNLVEIPTDAEIHDNIVAFWTPATPLKAGTEFDFAYRLNWGAVPAPEAVAVTVAATRRGRASSDPPTGERLFVIDFTMPAGGERGEAAPKATVTASAGTVSGVTVAEDPEIDGWRLTFKLDPADAASIELRAALIFADGRQVETWVYRWTGD